MNTLQAYPAPTLLSLHQNPDYYGLQVGKDKSALLAHMLGMADWVTTVSQSILSKLLQAAPELATRSTVVYNGLPAPPMIAAPLPFHPAQLLCLGRLIPRKGFDLALAALAELFAQHPATQLTLAGEGILRASLEQQAKELQLGERARFVGAIPPADIPSLLNSATVVVIPSRAEGLPMAALEAAQMARPVVATSFDGVDEVVIHGTTGLVVAQEDSSALAAAVSPLLDHQTTATQLGQNAQRHALTAFSLQKTATEYDALYQQLRQ